MDAGRLRYYCVIVEQGQISRAARALHISQPPLSRYLRELEERLGVTLIAREKGGWRLTEAGELLYVRAKKILAELDDLARAVKDGAESVNGEVVLGVSPTQENAVLRKLPAFHRQWPDIRLRLLILDSSMVEAGVVAGDIDLGVALLPVSERRLAVHYLPEEKYVVVSAKRGPASLSGKRKVAASSVTLDDVADFPLLLCRRWLGAGSYDDMMRHWQRSGKNPYIVLDGHHVSSLIRLVELGMPAACIVPESAVPGESRKRLDVRLLQSGSIRLCPVVLHRRDCFVSRSVEAALAMLLADGDGGTRVMPAPGGKTDKRASGSRNDGKARRALTK